MMLLIFVCFFLYLSQSRVVLEQESQIPSTWTKLKRISPAANLKLTFALKQNLKKLDDLFWKVSGFLIFSPIFLLSPSLIFVQTQSHLNMETT